jgi:S1-C subfamily serine protease
VFVLASSLAPGDSGGPLVNTMGQVLGVAFAIDPVNEGTSFALTSDEVNAVYETVGKGTVSTGRCLVG